MIASAMPAAMRPYSIAVAPDSSFTKRAQSFFVGVTPQAADWILVSSATQGRDHMADLAAEACARVNLIV
jgi:hypothetical protein